jgi:cell fate regulator YaaT (PSP1 superfamily)
MGCGNCGSGASGKPGGCKGNGGCSTGGCNRLNVYDWLSGLPLSDSSKPYPVIEVSFSNGSRKDFFRNNTNFIVEKGDWIALEGVSGTDIGQVNLTGELVKLQLKKYGVAEHTVNKRVLHPATDEELDAYRKQKGREAEVLIRSRAMARNLNLEMKLCEVEIQADGKKGTFFYTADQRVDFRELIKLFAGDFKMKIEMRQIGLRQESGKVGGIGSCGRELCCATWLTDFKSVNTTAARYQNLSINQTKLSGQCGRLKCCLNYELDTYMDALSIFPDGAEHLETVKGVAHLQKRDIFKSLMWYSYSDNNKQYPLSIVRVKEIQKLNRSGQKADELQPVEIETRDSKAGIKADMGFVNDVGQITLKALEKNKKKKKSSKPQAPGAGGQKPEQKAQAGEGQQPQGPNPNRPQRGNQPSGNRQQGNRPQQQAEGGQPQQPQQRQARPQQQNRPQQKPQQEGDATTQQPAEGAQPQQRPQGGNRPQQQNRPQRKPQQEGDATTQQPAEGAQPQQRPQGGNRPQQNRPQRQRPQQQGEGGAQQPNEGAAPQQPGENKPQQQNRPQQQRREGGQRPNQPNNKGGQQGEGGANQQQRNRGNRPPRPEREKSADQPPTPPPAS